MADIRSVLDTDKEAWAKDIIDKWSAWNNITLPQDFSTWSYWDQVLGLLGAYTGDGPNLKVKKESEFNFICKILYSVLHNSESSMLPFDTFVQQRSGQTESDGDEGGGEDEGGSTPK